MQLLCEICEKERPIIKRPKNGNAVCKQCFYFCFEEEIHQTITRGKLFQRNDRVAVASSGGKDSTVLGYVLKLLNERYDYGLQLVLLSIDEGITGYRDDSLESVKRNQKDYGLPLTILSYKDIYGWTMDDIVKQIGLKSNCTFCGVFRRQALDRGAMELNCNSIVTGHNADDLAETILMNVLRGDIARLKRSCFISTGFERSARSDGNEASSKDASISADSDANKERATDERVSNEFECNNQKNNAKDNLNANQAEQPVECCSGRLVDAAEEGTATAECCAQAQCLSNTIFKSPIGLLPRSKPFKYTYEKEIVMYAHFKKLDYFSTECIYSPNSYRGHARAFLKELEVIRPSVIIDIIHSGESVLVKDTLGLPQRGTCVRCGYISSQNICKACVMLEGLNKGQPRLGIGKSSKVALIKQVNQRVTRCKKVDCDRADCDGRSHRPTSKKQLKKQERLNKRDESMDLGLRIEQDVNRFMNGLKL